MTYHVKEMFFTIQGEGAQTGRPAVFCRFAGCNLWTGREADRSRAVCTFCDTDFVGTDGPGGGSFASAAELAATADSTWGDDRTGARRLVVCTGGEPTLQLDAALIDALHQRGFDIAIETNGTRPAPAGVDWICVSPKAGATLVQREGHELKLVYPQAGLDPESFRTLGFAHFLLQPMDGETRPANTRAALDYCRRHSQWRLSLQTHKFLGLR